jgi:spermidine synthase
MIGLGGGELPQYLLHHCPNMQIDAVELNGDVISLARTYFGLGESETSFPGRLSIQQADALTAVRERASGKKSYDAVLVDCFSGGGEVPETCRSRSLAEKVKAILKPRGVLLQNIWHYSRMRQVVAQEFKDTKAIYSDVFEGLVDDLLVPMPPEIRWVDILKATKM